MSPRRCRLYLITPPEIADIAAFARQLDEALDAGDVASLQLRLKSREGIAAPDSHILELGRHIIPRAQERGIAVLVNDRPDLAMELGADGVHIGQGDIPYAKARKLVGPDAIVGVTCHDSRHLAMEAGEAGADYVAFGAFHPTDTKDAKAKAELELLTWWQAMMELPCVAIAGSRRRTPGRWSRQARISLRFRRGSGARTAARPRPCAGSMQFSTNWRPDPPHPGKAIQACLLRLSGYWKRPI